MEFGEAPVIFSVHSISTIRPLATVKAARTDRAGNRKSSPLGAIDDDRLGPIGAAPALRCPARHNLGPDERGPGEGSRGVRTAVDPRTTSLEEFVAEARRHPVFELRPLTDTPPPSPDFRPR